MAERLSGSRRFADLRRRSGLSLTGRILLVNLLPLLLLGGGLFYLDSYRKQLIEERVKLARIEAQITAEALAGATRQRQEALLIQIGKEQAMRLRMYDAEGNLWADSFELDGPAYTLSGPDPGSTGERVARNLDKAVDAIVGADPIPDYAEPDTTRADGWPELARARAEGLTQIELRDAPDGTPVISAAAPVGLKGSTLLTTRNADDITRAVRSARSTLSIGVGLALLISILLSLWMARTIVSPLRNLAHAALRVKRGREREVEVPRLEGRWDEIGVLARAVADMTDTMRHRIDAVESFAADVAHEIKNPLASMRSAIESLCKVEDPALRSQLMGIAMHDFQRIDRLVTDISDASRIDAELSRTAFEPVDLAALVERSIHARMSISDGAGPDISLDLRDEGPFTVEGDPARLERIFENLLDNAVSFTPPDGKISVTMLRDGDEVVSEVSDEGPGIAHEDREKIFERFHSHRPESEDFGGHSGLGLAIARTIAEGHEGSLRAISRADGDQGACFRVELPVRPRG